MTPAFHLSIAVCAWPCAQVTVSAKASRAPSAPAAASAAAYHFGGWVLTAVRRASAVSPLSSPESSPFSPSPVPSNAARKARSFATVAVISAGLP
nr:hypothetical protein [Streptomyces sp. AC1-42W]